MGRRHADRRAADRHARYVVCVPAVEERSRLDGKVSAVLVELKPTKRQHEDILIEAGRMSGRLKRELAGDDDR
jgi:hypothetical protein